MTVTDEETLYKEVIGDVLVRKCVSALLQQHQQHQQGTNSRGKKFVFADATAKKAPIHLDIQSFKIPVSVPKRDDRPLHPKINRLLLPHTLTDSSSGVLLVTKDYPKPGNPTISNAHFQKLITTAGCNHLVSEVMSLSQLKAEHSELESRKELCSRIDAVLCDKAVTNIVPRLLGKPFLISKKFPMAVKMDSDNLKKEIEKVLRFSSHKMTFRNVQSALILGHTGMPEQQLVDNLHCCLQYLCSVKFPGSWENVKTLYLTAGLKGRVPLYVSTASAEDVPNILIMKPEPEVFEGDFGFGNIKITATGHVLDYEPHPDDTEPAALRIFSKRQGKSGDESRDSEAPENKKRKTSSSRTEAKSSGQIKKTKLSKKKRAGKSKKPVGKSSKNQPTAAVIHTTRVETF